MMIMNHLTQACSYLVPIRNKDLVLFLGNTGAARVPL